MKRATNKKKAKMYQRPNATAMRPKAIGTTM
jgi:hypothetical protein